MKTTIIFQRTEAGALLVAILYAYYLVHGSWWFLLALWLVFDLSMLGYLVNDRIGAYFYNVGHSFILPAILTILSLIYPRLWLWEVTLIWGTHITLDRLLGYGLKGTCGFAHTHLGLIGPNLKKE